MLNVLLLYINVQVCHRNNKYLFAEFFWFILVYIVQYQHYIFAELREALNLVAILTMCIHTCTCLSCL